MIYTVGYQALVPRQLQTILDTFEIDYLIDVRSIPQSRRPGFSRKALEHQFGEHDLWRGNVLGGRKPGVLERGLDELRKLQRGHKVCLLCLESNPAYCHRHAAICGPHFPAARHIYDREWTFTARALTRALAGE
jgi:uncharacterized protein (DUF488 family)